MEGEGHGGWGLPHVVGEGHRVWGSHLVEKQGEKGKWTAMD